MLISKSCTTTGIEALVYLSVVYEAYAPFGMLMPGRKYAAGSLSRYGFNGKENDNEVDGEGGQQDYGMRIYDPRIGRFLSKDPIAGHYPWLTPYQFGSNKPIVFIDLDGLEAASPEEWKRAKSYLENSIKPYITQNAAKRAFVNINPVDFINAVENLLSDPGSLKKRAEGVGWMCGPYAFTYLYAIYEPVKFIQGAADLFITGVGHNIGGLDVTPDSRLKKANSNTDPNSLLTLIFGGSLRSHYNQTAEYGGAMGKAFGSTNSSTMKAWLEDRLNLEVNEFDYGHEKWGNGLAESDLPILMQHVNSGKHAVIRLSFNLYNAGTNATKGQGIESELISGGDHWIVLSGITTSPDQKNISFQAFDMGRGLQTVEMSVKQFCKMINHVLMVQRKEEKKAP